MLGNGCLREETPLHKICNGHSVVIIMQGRDSSGCAIRGYKSNAWIPAIYLMDQLAFPLNCRRLRICSAKELCWEYPKRLSLSYHSYFVLAEQQRIYVIILLQQIKSANYVVTQTENSVKEIWKKVNKTTILPHSLWYIRETQVHSINLEKVCIPPPRKLDPIPLEKIRIPPHTHQIRQKLNKGEVHRGRSALL